MWGAASVSCEGGTEVDDEPTVPADAAPGGDLSHHGASGPWWTRTWAWAHDHPLLVVLAVAASVAVLQGWWIWTHRQVGALDPDEAGYIATALRYHRVLQTDPLAMPRAIGGTGNGPLVPLLSVPLLWVGPLDPRTVLLMQPILMVVTAVAGAGIARRLAGSGAAIVSGTVFMTLPTVVFASQTYWLGLGAAAFMALGIWALVESDRLTNRWTYAYGACTGAMLLCRTMTLGFLPAMLMAGLVVAGRERRSLVGLARAVGVAAVVAVPWWFVAREAIFGYLFSYGYGDRAGLFGSGGPLTRLGQRVDAVRLGVGVGAWWIRIVIVCSGVVVWRSWRGWPRQTRSALAIAVAVALGIAALASTSNNGVWFELPIIALLVPLGVSAGARAPVAVRAVALVPVLVVGLLQLACATWVISPQHGRVPGVATVHRVAQYEYGFEQYDVRFGPYRRWEQPKAAAAWWALSTDVERHLSGLSPDRQTVFTFSGNFEMFNTNTVELAAELRGWTPRSWVPDTVLGGRAGRAKYLTPFATDDAGNRVTRPDGSRVERVLVLALHDLHLFTPDAKVAELHREALRRGWRTEARFELPVGGEVLIMRHPSSS